MKFSKKQYETFATYFCMIGAIICFCGFAFADFDWNNLSTATPYEEIETLYDIQNIEKITIDANLEDIQILPSNDNEVHIKYYENNQSTYDIDTLGTTLSIKQKNTKKFYEYFMSMNFHMFDTDKSLQIALPASYDKKLEVNTTDGKIELQGMTALETVDLHTTLGSVIVSDLTVNQSMNISTVDHDITLHRVIVAQDLEADTKLGSIQIVQSEAGKAFLSSIDGKIELQDEFITSSLQTQTTLGDITFDRLRADQIDLSTLDGDIKGKVIGAQADYTITSDMANGNSTLSPSSGVTDKTLKASTKIGECSITFTE